jgi:hypothetical protein
MPKWLIIIDTVSLDVDEDTMNKHAGNLAGRIGRETYVVQVRKLRSSERVKVVE